jgi:hypothetical protein
LPGISRSRANVIIVTISTTMMDWSTLRIRNAATASPFRPAARGAGGDRRHGLGLTHDRYGSYA